MYCLYNGHGIERFAPLPTSTARYSNQIKVYKLTTTDFERLYIHLQNTAPYPTKNVHVHASFCFIPVFLFSCDFLSRSTSGLVVVVCKHYLIS